MIRLMFAGEDQVGRCNGTRLASVARGRFLLRETARQCGTRIYSQTASSRRRQHHGFRFG